MVAAGASRVGASAGVRIVREAGGAATPAARRLLTPHGPSRDDDGQALRDRAASRRDSRGSSVAGPITCSVRCGNGISIPSRVEAPS